MANRKISQLTALTTPASGDYLPIVDISEAANADKNKRITIEELMRGAPDGTAAAPSIAFESDPNTGIYSPGADTVGVTTGGTERLRIDSAGNVGIGTSSPTENVTIYGTTCRLAVTGATGASAILLGNQNSGGVNNPAVIWSSNGNLNFGGGNSWSGGGTFDTAMTVLDSGNVGIGTSSPAQLLHLQSSDPIIQLTRTGSHVARLSAPSGGGFSIGADGSDGSTTRLRIDNSGNVGIGTSGPTTLLDVNADTMRLRTARTPASAGATGAVGEICWDANYIYVCTATNTWKRAALSTW